MSATLSSIKVRQSFLLANSKTGSYTSEERTLAVNDAIKEILYLASWPKLTTYSDVSFVAGVGTIPTGFHHAIKLSELNTDESIKTDYDFAEQIEFLDNIADTYTITDVSGTQRLKIYEADTVTLRLWYVKRPFSTDLSDETDSTGLEDDFDAPIAMISAAILIRNKNRGSAEPSVLRYGGVGLNNRATDDSAYGLLGKILRQQKKYSKQYTGQLRCYHDTHNFYA